VLIPTFADAIGRDGGGGWVIEKSQIFWAIGFGSILAITGCGDDPVENGGSAGSGGGDFCSELCQACGNAGAAQCTKACQGYEDTIPGELDKCPPEFNTLLACYEANGCDGSACDEEVTAWATCIFLP